MPFETPRYIPAAMLLTLVLLAACGQAPADAASPAKTAPAGDGPCALLETTEVDAILPGVKAGKRDRSREEYGIAACIWSHEGRSFELDLTTAEGSAENEIRGQMQGYVDPLKIGAMNNVRFEKMSGIGDEAFALIENTDAARGILSDVAILVAKYKGQFIVLGGSSLGHTDRAKALAALEQLGRSAVGRL